jgi:hypothetical protein
MRQRRLPRWLSIIAANPSLTSSSTPLSAAEALLASRMVFASSCPGELVGRVGAGVAEEGDGLPDHRLQPLGVAGGRLPGGIRGIGLPARDDRAQALHGSLEAVDQVRRDLPDGGRLGREREVEVGAGERSLRSAMILCARWTLKVAAAMTAAISTRRRGG